MAAVVGRNVAARDLLVGDEGQGAGARGEALHVGDRDALDKGDGVLQRCNGA